MSSATLCADRSAHDLAIVRGIVHTLAAPYHARVFLFGSYANGSAVASSDIDIAVLANAPLPAAFMLELRDARDDANILARVDLVDLARVESPFRRRVLQEGVEWTAI